MMKFFGLPNLSSQDVEEVDPTTAKHGGYPEGDKVAMREWNSMPTTQHIYYSTVEGLTPSLRVTKENPPCKLHGLVVDYDAKIDAGMVASISKNGVKGMLPQWVSTTFSGGRRLVWVFEAPILIDHQDLAQRVLKWLNKELKLNNVLPGLDKSSFDYNQYWELGKGWEQISTDVVSSDFLSLCIVKAANEKVITSGDTEIPIELVAEEVEKKFPNRWKGEFKEGARGALFWIDDGIDRVGAQVGTFGMICYSERAGKAFVSWREIFGYDFIRDFEAKKIGNAAEGIWFDGKSYWRRNENGEWRSRTKDDQIMWLKGQGLSAKTEKNKTISDAEAVLLATQEFRSVAQAVPFVLDNRETISDGGYRFLNVAVKKAMVAAESGTPEQFPWLHTFFSNIWDKKQSDHFFAWLQRFYVSGSQGRLQAGHAIFIAGEKNQGKTFLNQFIIGQMMGGYADATSYLLGETRFNKECGENAHWAVDDAKGLDTVAAKKAFGESVKKQIATPRVHMEAKFRDSCTLPWAGRIGVTCNIDPDSLSVIPSMDNTVADKLMLFKFNTYQPVFYENEVLENMVKKELPYFCAWLRDWKAPDYVTKGADIRYGVRAYHHPDMIETAEEGSPLAGFEETLDMWAKARREVRKEDSCELSATELLCDMNETGGLKHVLKFYTSSNIGRTLRSLATMKHSRIKGFRRNSKHRRYTIDLT